MSVDEEIAYMLELERIYLDNMEGTDLEEFLKWEALACAAHLIRTAMEEENGNIPRTNGQPEPAG